MRTRSKTRKEKGLPKAPVPWVPKKTRNSTENRLHEALPLTRSLQPKRRAIVKIKTLDKSTFIQLVRLPPRTTSEACNPITVDVDDDDNPITVHNNEDTVRNSLDLGTDNSGQLAVENIVVDPLETENCEKISVSSDRISVVEEFRQFNGMRSSVSQQATCSIADTTSKKRTPSLASFMTDNLLSKANSLFNSNTVDLTDICYNTNVSDKNWILRKYLGLPVPSIESDIAAWDDSVIMGYSPIRANYGTERLSMASGKRKKK